MHIAYVINSLEGGGAAALIPAIAAFFEAHGASIKVYALAPRNRKALPRLQAAGLNVTARTSDGKDHFRAYHWLRSELHRDRPTHIITSLTRATLIGQQVGSALGVPVISWQHNAFLKPANAILLRLTQSRSALWLGDSRFVTELTQQRLHISGDRIVNWPVFLADPDTPTARPWSHGEAVRIGSLGRFHVSKGYDVLCKAVALLKSSNDVPPIELSIRGAGTDSAPLRAMAQEHGLTSIRFDSFVDDPSTFLTTQHLYTQPSRREGFCIAAHEGMLAGLGVVASAVGEMRHSVIEDVTGWQAEPDNPQALATALHKALSRPDKLHTVGAAARALVLDRYSRSNFNAAGEEVLAALSRSRSRSA